MAVSATVLDGKIQTALTAYNNGEYKNDPNQPQHLKIIGDTMKDYFEENTEITYSWAAVLPPPTSTPDPVTSFKSKVSFPDFDITPSHNLDDMALYIHAAFVAAKINHASGFSVNTGTFLAPAPPVFGRTTEAATAIYTCIIVPLCAWVLTLINPAALAGAHGAFTGATTGMVIA
jgi:hypothetical protein